jgi:hypothetical protein
MTSAYDSRVAIYIVLLHYLHVTDLQKLSSLPRVQFSMSRLLQNPILYQLFEGPKLHVNEVTGNRNLISVEPQTRDKKF